MILVDNKLNIIKSYNKRKLVPFGEFIPFEKLLSKIGFKKITQGHGSFSKGSIQENIVFNELNILPLICYEIIFPELIQEAIPQTNLIVNISEDGWFGNSIGPHQHYAKAIFRAIENNTFLVRSANKGISVIISNKGDIVKKLNNNESGNIDMEIPLLNNQYKNKNDLIFLTLLFTYLLLFLIIKIKTNAKNNFLFTSESVSEGHPDKVCDRISDMVVDTYLSKDPFARVACETLTTTNKVVLAGETRGPKIHRDDIINKVRECIKDIGYDQKSSAGKLPTLKLFYTSNLQTLQWV